MRVNMLAARLGHGGGQLAVGEADENDGEATGGKCDEGAERSCRFDPVAADQHPTPADHGAEGEQHDIPAAEHLVEARTVSRYGGWQCLGGL